MALQAEAYQSDRERLFSMFADDPSKATVVLSALVDCVTLKPDMTLFEKEMALYQRDGFATLDNLFTINPEERMFYASLFERLNRRQVLAFDDFTKSGPLFARLVSYEKSCSSQKERLSLLKDMVVVYEVDKNLDRAQALFKLNAYIAKLAVNTKSSKGWLSFSFFGDRNKDGEAFKLNKTLALYQKLVNNDPVAKRDYPAELTQLVGAPTN